MAKVLIREAESDSQGKPGEGSGEFVLQKLKAKPALYDARRAEGVTDADIRNYCDKGAVFQRTMDLLAEQAMAVMFLQERDDALARGASEDEASVVAGVRARKFHPVYGDPAEQQHGGPADRPIYAELRDRIDRIVGPRWRDDRPALMAELEAASSFNAWARQQLGSQ